MTELSSPVHPLESLSSAAARLGLALNSQQLTALHRYAELMSKWTAVYNLTAVRSTSGILLRHIIDCMACVDSLRRRAPEARSILDVGSGAGLPGIVLAVAMPELQVTCVDSVGKKVAFLRQAVAELGLGNVTAIHSRVEAMQELQYPLITARALGPLGDLIELTRHLLSEDGRWMAMKAGLEADELAALVDRGITFHVEPLQPVAEMERRNLVWMHMSQRSLSS